MQTTQYIIAGYSSLKNPCPADLQPDISPSGNYESNRRNLKSSHHHQPYQLPKYANVGARPSTGEFPVLQMSFLPLLPSIAPGGRSPAGDRAEIALTLQLQTAFRHLHASAEGVVNFLKKNISMLTQTVVRLMQHHILTLSIVPV